VSELDTFTEVWVIDFEFQALPGERPDPVCLVGHELRSGRWVRVWRDALHRIPCPYATDARTLVIGFYVSAEFTCTRVLGWPSPTRVLDLYVEFRNLVNGRYTGSSGLLGAAAAFGLGAMTATAKDQARELIMRGGPWSPAEQDEILSYCQADVQLTTDLARAMLPRIDLPRALLRGRFMDAIAGMEHRGVPVDAPMWRQLCTAWPTLKGQLIDDIDQRYGVFEAGVFRRERFATWLTRAGIPWPLLPSGELELTDDAFRQMSKAYPRVSALRELRHALSQLRLSELAVGADGRNRTLLSPFRAKTSRCAPSTSRFVFGPSVWLRSLVRPERGRALAYVDWSQQEFGIAAALSQDPRMMDAYQSGDPYLTFAKQTGAVPAYATKASHGPMRELFKTVSLGVQYGMRETSLAARIGRSESEARDLLRRHRDTYPQFWRWSDAAVDCAMLHGRISTVFGWQLYAGPASTVRTFSNFPMQSNGAEMLRVACIEATARGVGICAPVHDAVLIEDSAGRIDQAVRTMREAMGRASRAVLAGFELQTDAEIIRYPKRYRDPRGAHMWATVQRLLRAAPARSVAPSVEIAAHAL
jgi:DNA polymerase I